MYSECKMNDESYRISLILQTLSKVTISINPQPMGKGVRVHQDL
jgi:hypothetical protein